MSTIKMITIAAIAFAVIGLLTTCGLYLRGLHNQISDLRDNCTAQEKEIAIFVKDQQAASKTITALQTQMTEYLAINAENQRRMRDQLNIIKGFTTTSADPLIKKGEVIDYETSRRVIGDLNRSFVGAWMRPAEGAGSGEATVRKMPAPPDDRILPTSGRASGFAR